MNSTYNNIILTFLHNMGNKLVFLKTPEQLFFLSSRPLQVEGVKNEEAFL